MPSPQSSHQARVSFWLQWTLANSISWALGLGIALLLARAVYIVGPASPPVKSVPPPAIREVGVFGSNPDAGLICTLLAGVLLGTLIGGAQALVLRHVVPTKRWVFASAIGWALGIGLGEFLNWHPLGLELENISGIPPFQNLLKLTHPFVVGAALQSLSYLGLQLAVGATFGILGSIFVASIQWAVIWRRETWQYIIAIAASTILAWTLGLPLGLLVSYLVTSVLSFFCLGIGPLVLLFLSGTPTGIVTGALIGLIQATISGLTVPFQAQSPQTTLGRAV